MNQTLEHEEKQQRLQGRLGPEIAEFRQQCQTLQLATVDEAGQPNVSYAPFVMHDKAYYILISQIARHARNLLAQPKVSLMLVEDEAQAKSIFARKRLTFDASVQTVARDTEQWQQVIALLTERFGEIVTGLSILEDFVLFQLTPQQGLFVKGFGQAFQVSGEDLVDFVHLTEGHKPIAKVD